MSSKSLPPAERAVGKLRNLGPKSAAWLAKVDVRTESDLHACGPVVAYQMVKHRDKNVSINLLWALFGAVHDRDWRDLTDAEKSQLLAELDA